MSIVVSKLAMCTKGVRAKEVDFGRITLFSILSILELLRFETIVLVGWNEKGYGWLCKQMFSVSIGKG